MPSWVWWLLGIGAVGGVGYYIVSSSTGKRLPAKTACVADLPEADRTEVKKAIDAGDAAAMTAIAARFDGRGFTCAATELRAAALKARAATAGIDAIPEPQRSAWKKLLDRALSEADPDGDLISSLEVASRDAASAGYAKVRDLLRDASRDVRRTIKIARITEEPPKKKVDDALAAAREKPAKATVDALRALAAQLRSLGYEGAAKEADATADNVELAVAAAGPAKFSIEHAGEMAPVASTAVSPSLASCKDEVYALPPGPAPYKVSDSVWQPSNVRQWVIDALLDGGSDRIKYTADWLEAAGKTILDHGGTIDEAYPYSKAATCVRGYVKPIFLTDTTGDSEPLKKW